MFTKDVNEVKSSKTGYYPTINCLYSMIPRETREHMERVGKYSEDFYRFIRVYHEDNLREELGEDFENYSQQLFRYYDIGRIYIPFAVLNKVEKLTDEEFQLIKDHAANAVPAIESIYKKPFPAHIMEELKKNSSSSS